MLSLTKRFEIMVGATIKEKLGFPILDQSID